MFDKQWIFDIKKHNEYTEFCEENGRKTSFVDEIMYKRGIDGRIGGVEMLSDPYILPDMAKAVDRIMNAVEDGEKIAVFGDYDADGVTATAVLYHFLKNVMEADVIMYIPDRLTEGYGMSTAAIDTIGTEGVTLIITVDNGIVAFEQIEYAMGMGIDVVVTDHHKCGDRLPTCCAVVNPCIIKEETPLSRLCGAGVAFTLIRAIADEMGAAEEIYKYIPIVMIGTLGDVVPLAGDNRIIVKYGMENISGFGWTGLDKLIEKINTGKATSTSISSMFVSFQLVPKLNAAGRLGNAVRAFELLICEDEAEAECLAEELIQENAKRQEKEAEIVEMAMQEENIKTSDTDAVVVALGENWHHGVIGIVAARITEKYKKPSFVLTIDKDSTESAGINVAKGSARSVKGFDLHKALTSCADLLVQFGGHEMAAGLSIKVDKIEEFIKRINKFAEENAESILPANIEIDAVVAPEEISVETVEKLADLEPYGPGNVQPVLCVRNLQPISCTKVGEKGKHLRITLCAEASDGRKLSFEGIAFSRGAYEGMVKSIGKVCSIACRAEINVWQGRKGVSLLIADIFDGDYNIDNKLKCVYNSDYTTDWGFTLQRETLVVMYKQFAKFGESFKFNDLYRVRDNMRKMGIQCTWYAVRNGLDVFIELGLIKRKDKQTYIIEKNTEKVDLTKSGIYKKAQAEV